MIGEILRTLEINGLRENTLIVYTSDHGEQVGEHGLWWKQTFYEDSVRVPAIISWPDFLPDGIHSDRVISQIDLNATMLDLIGAPPLPNSHGRSLVRLMKDPQNAEWEDVAFSEYCTDTTSEALSPEALASGESPEGWYHRMVRWNEWKLIYYHGLEPQLFNLRDDPDELHDLAQDPEHGDIRKQLTERVLHGWKPDVIAETMKRMVKDQPVLTEWAKQVRPREDIRWDLGPEMDYLDESG